MKIDPKILKRLNDLIVMGSAVVRTRYSRSGPGYAYLGDDGVDPELSRQWGTSCLSILERVFGKDSTHFTKFDSFYARFKDFTPVTNALGVLKAAKDDYENDYLFDTKVLIQAEVFDDFLEQAQHLYDNGYYAPAAVVAGSVLEDSLRKLCARNGVSLPANPKMDTMNADLVKAGTYNILVQKQITALADLRNKAAHGRWSEFTANDVEQMLVQVRNFMTTHFS